MEIDEKELSKQMFNEYVDKDGAVCIQIGVPHQELDEDGHLKDDKNVGIVTNITVNHTNAVTVAMSIITMQNLIEKLRKNVEVMIAEMYLSKLGHLSSIGWDGIFERKDNDNED